MCYNIRYLLLKGGIFFIKLNDFGLKKRTIKPFDVKFSLFIHCIHSVSRFAQGSRKYVTFYVLN